MGGSVGVGSEVLDLAVALRSCCGNGVFVLYVWEHFASEVFFGVYLLRVDTRHSCKCPQASTY
jgi:hypothetical protein